MNSEHGNSARAVIEQIWYRARINAFAHREAMSDASQRDVDYFRYEVLAALGSILSIIIVYVLSTNTKEMAWLEWLKPILGIVFTLASVSLTLTSLYLGVMSSHLKLSVRASEHQHLLGKYQYIAQRAREVKWPDLPAEDVIALLKDLERDFQLLKATGTEPDDRHFDKAHELVRKIRDDKDVRIAQSYEIGTDEEVAQHIGATTTVVSGSADRSERE